MKQGVRKSCGGVRKNEEGCQDELWVYLGYDESIEYLGGAGGLSSIGGIRVDGLRMRGGT